MYQTIVGLKSLWKNAIKYCELQPQTRICTQMYYYNLNIFEYKMDSTLAAPLEHKMPISTPNISFLKRSMYVLNGSGVEIAMKIHTSGVKNELPGPLDCP